jgi:hypothetical protein
MKKYLEEVRQNLLKEAIASPNLLSDLTGLENYIAESYNNRSFIELLQNADDAKASKFKIVKKSDLLFVANNGRIFNQGDLESLCRSASSNKYRGETIGYRGIGFKSVVGFAKEIYLFSGEIELTFSKELTKKEIPQAERVPLIRIPHRLSEFDENRFSQDKAELVSEGYSTIFIFSGITASEIENEFESFKYNSLLFLRNIEKTEITLKDTTITEILKTKISDSQFKSTFNSNNEITNWLIYFENQMAIAFSIVDNEIKKISKEDSLVHAFLPTEEITGLGVLINGNFSTDPSRRHLIFDAETKESIKQSSFQIVKLIKHCINNNDKNSIGIINASVPYSDSRMLQFGKNSFAKCLLDEMKLVDIEFFRGLKLPPTWLNHNDYLKLIPNTAISLNNQHFGIEGFVPLLKYLGACETNFDEIKNTINNSDISVLGCVQITQFLFKSILIFSIIKESEILKLKILLSGGVRKSISELDEKSRLDDSFVSLLLENGLTEFDIKQVLKKFSLTISLESEKDTYEQSNIILDTNENGGSVGDWFNNSSKQGNYITSQTAVKKWRSAEEQTLEVLNMNGFKLEDVSKQNIGFDLSGTDPNGNEIQIEVKSITLPGQKFRLTNNEIAVAQVKQKSFFVAIVRQTDDFLEIALVSDPVNNLLLNRQCVQWIWECESYEYKPLKFKIE